MPRIQNSISRLARRDHDFCGFCCREFGISEAPTSLIILASRTGRNWELHQLSLHKLLGGGVCGIELEGEAPVRERLRQFALRDQQLAQGPMDVGQVGLAAQGRAKRLDGSDAVTEQDQAVAEV